MHITEAGFIKMSCSHISRYTVDVSKKSLTSTIFTNIHNHCFHTFLFMEVISPSPAPDSLSKFANIWNYLSSKIKPIDKNIYYKNIDLAKTAR